MTSEDYTAEYERVLNPNTGSSMSYLLTGVISGANDYATGKTTDFSTVGIKAIDDYTLEFKLSHVVPYFEEMLSFQTYYPSSKAAIEKYGDKFATSADTAYYNGAFYATEVEVTYETKLVKNEKWYNATNVQLDGVTFRTLIDPQATYSAFTSGDIDYFNTTDNETYENGITGSDSKAIDRLTGYTFFMSLNQDSSRSTSDKDLRESLYYGFDRENINISSSGKINKPIEYFVPKGITTSNYDDVEYRDSAKDSYGSFDKDRAKKALDRYMVKNGITDPEKIELSFLIDDTAGSKKTATAVQESYKQILGITIKTDIQPNSSYRTSRAEGAFDIAGGGWGPDYGDPSTYFDLFKSENIGSINFPRYNSKDYDQKAVDSAETTNVEARFEGYATLENKILTENLVIIPFYQKNDPYFINPKYELPNHLFLNISDAYVKIK